MRRFCSALLALAIAALSLAMAASSAPAPVGAAGPLRMTVGTLGSIGSLDPRHGDSVIAREVWNLQYPTLTALDPKTLAPTTGIADAWSPLPGGHGWTYSLRPGQTWSDGQPVTATDVVYSFDHARDDHWAYAASLSLSGLSMRATNAHTVVVTSRVADDPPGLLLHIVPAHVYSKVADLGTNVTALGVADGAWHVVATAQDSVELGVLGRPAGPPLDQITFRTYPSAGALLSALSHRDVDVISGAPDSDVGRLESMSKVTVDHAPDGTEFVLRDTLTDPRVRSAVSLAIDRVGLVAQTVNGVGTPARIDAQPDGAVQELSSLKGTSALNLTMAVPTDATSRSVGAFVQSALGAVGLHTNLIDVAPHEKIKVKADLFLELMPAVSQTAGDIPLFEPDLLQAFRTDNVTGFLQEPSQRSLVVFGPTVAQYGAIVGVQHPPGEELSNTFYAIAGAVLLALCVVAYWLALLVRRRVTT